MDTYVTIYTTHIDIPNILPYDLAKIQEIKKEKDLVLYKQLKKKNLEYILYSKFEKSKSILQQISILNKNAIMIFSLTKQKIPQKCFVLNNGIFYEFKTMEDAQAQIISIMNLENYSTIAFVEKQHKKDHFTT